LDGVGDGDAVSALDGAGDGEEDGAGVGVEVGGDPNPVENLNSPTWGNFFIILRKGVVI